MLAIGLHGEELETHERPVVEAPRFGPGERAAAGLALGAVLLAGSACPVAGAYRLHSFERMRLTADYYAEGGSFGDFNRDGIKDVVAGPYWYAGPEFKAKQELYEPKIQDVNRYADNFFSFVHDLNGDGWEDVLVVGFPGTPLNWYENPKDGSGHWAKHEVFDWVSNESPHFTDLVGDDRPEVVCTRDGRFGYVAVNWEAPREKWNWHPISGDTAPKRFGHGLGVGDVDGDGRKDVLCKDGWYEQPESLASEWAFHKQEFTRAGGAQMYAYDVDGDGDNDVITSLAAHDHGLAWFEQKRAGEKIEFDRHLIMGVRPSENRYGVCFSELHAVDLQDIDGDGLKDIVTGKTYWSHHRQTPSWHDGAVVYWFRLTREGGRAEFVPHRADTDSGVGRQVVAGDLNGDGWPDIVSANMQGTFALIHRVREVSEGEWNRAQPAVYGETRPVDEVVGRLPVGTRTGKPLNLDFETGTLKDWRAEGEAFTGQPVMGEIDPKRKWGEGKKALPQGNYWLGGFERSLDDAPKGTLESEPFRITERYASYRIGGGCLGGIRMELVDAGTGLVIFQTHGRNSERMFPEVIDLGRHQGETIFIRLVDAEGGGFGHLNFDDFRFHEEQPLFEEAVCMMKEIP